MHAALKWILVPGFVLIAAPALLGQTASAPTAASPPLGEWAIVSAPARFVIELDDTEKVPLFSWINLDLPDPKWATTPIRVFTESGVAVGSDVLWAAPGEPATLLFDSSSGAKRYDVYFGSNWPALHLANAKSGVILESRVGDGTSIGTLPAMLQAWNQSATNMGSAVVEGLFEGGNRFGPEGNILEHFRGWFNADAPEHLELATISSDASFALVDGKEVVEWPGLHDFHAGLQGQHQGAVDLPAGLHFLDYYNAYVAGKGHPLLCCLAVKGGDLAQWKMLMPQTQFFLPTARAHVLDYALQTSQPDGSAPPFAMEWAIADQSIIGPEIADLGFISVQLTCWPKPAGKVTWSFDDGSTAEGDVVTHLFPRPGMRSVQLVVNGEAGVLGSLRQTIDVHPNWTELTTLRPQLLPADKANILTRNLATFSASDLAGCAAVLGTYEDADGLLQLAPALTAKMKEVGDADLPYILNAALFLAGGDLSHSGEAGQLLSALVERCSVPNSSPSMTALASAARLALAQLTLKTSDDTGKVQSLLAAVNVKALSEEDLRSLRLLQADLALAMGDVAGARKQDESLTPAPTGPDARSSVRLTSEIDHARVFIERKDFDAAQESLDRVARQSPIEKLSPDWALTQLRLYQAENFTLCGYLWAKRLLPVITESGRSELLFRLTALALAQGDKGLASKVWVELLKKHPYSQEAANAKQKWPEGIPGG